MMRTMNKGGVIAALTAALLVTAVLITSCSGPSGGDATSGYKPPEGMGYVRISITANGRSIAPGDITANDVKKVDLTFTKRDKSGGTPPYPQIGTAITKPNISVVAGILTPAQFDLFPGDYTVTVVAYIDEPGGTLGTDFLAVAIGESDPATPFSISAGASAGTQAVDVEPYDPALAIGDGTFKYTINTNTVTPAPVYTDPPGPVINSTLMMTLSPILGGGPYLGGTAFAATPDAPTTITLREGYYYVDIVFTSSGKTTSLRQVLHIYRNLISEYTITFTNASFINLSGTVIIGINVLPTPDKIPVLIDDDTPNPNSVNEQLLGPLSSATSATTYIEVENVSDFDSIEWRTYTYVYDSGTDTWTGTLTPIATGEVSGSDGEILTIKAGAGSFIATGTYHIVVEGTVDASAGPPATPKRTYDTWFKVTINP